tara:strand:+ start:455 stop:715 length:261 start_codon:yes stop_codon:yes gene_type:complete
MRYKLKFDRNKKQLQNIVQDKIDYLWRLIEELKETKGWDEDHFNHKPKIEILHWVKEMLDNPKKWDWENGGCDGDYSDTEIFEEKV